MMSVEMHPETAVGSLKAGAHSFPLQAVDVRGTVRGLLYSATVTQKFQNDRDTRMEAVYTFPLPPKAAVHSFTLTIGERVIQGEIKERGAARREYAQAVAAGHRAALMEEERSDIFTTTVGNIGPGEEVEIKFELSGPLSCFKNTARLRMPLVVGEVYIPGRALAGDSVGEGTEVDTDQVPDASRITPPRLADGVPNPVALSVSFEVEPSGLQLVDVVSTCHFARSKKYQDGRYRVSLLPGVERMDRAFVLEVTYPENTLQTSVLWDPASKAFALTVVPPVSLERTAHPRDVVILLDRSGSMSGWPMIAARRATARIIESLNESDRFGIVAYDGVREHFDLKQGLCEANNFTKMRAAEYLSKIDARGGTEMLPALQEGLRYFGAASNRDPHVILVTDGDVGNDSAMIRSAQTGVRISTVGIGYAAREGLLNRIAETSGGLCTLIPNEADLEKELVDMHRKWGQPVWKGLSMRGLDESYRSPKFWDVWQDVPTTFFGKAELEQLTEVNGWYSNRGSHSVEVAVQQTEDPLVYRAWARSRLLDLEDLFLVNKATPAEMVELSVSAQVLCRFTAFTAVDKTQKVDMEQEMEKVVQPVEQTIQRKQASAAPLRSRSVVFGSIAQNAPGDAGGGGVMRDIADDCDEMFCDDGAMFGESVGEAADLFCMEPECEAAAPEPMQRLESLAPPKASEMLKSSWLGGAPAPPPAPPAAPSPAKPSPPIGKAKEFHRSQSLPTGNVSPRPGVLSKVAKKVSSILSKADELTSLSKKQAKKESSASEKDAFEAFLRADQLPSKGASPDPKALKTSLKAVDDLIKALSAMMRAGDIDQARENSLKAILSKLHDYKEALQDALDGESPSAAIQLRAELEREMATS